MTKRNANHTETYSQRQCAETEEGVPESILALVARLDPKFFSNSRSRRALAQDRPVSLGRHRRNCSICRHPEREAIEEAFLHWRSPEEIAESYGLAGWSAVYRHVRAFGLFEARRRNARYALESIIERVHEIEVVTPSAVVAAVRAFACINKEGHWVEPPKHIVFTYVTEEGSQQVQEEQVVASEGAVALSAIEKSAAAQSRATSPAEANNDPTTETEERPESAEITEENEK